MYKMMSMPVVVVLAATGVSAAPGKPALKGGALAPMAKVSLARARHTALASRPGVITDQELEKEKGGSGLRYSFDINSKGKTFEVGVDARTGKVLENAADGAQHD